MKRRFIVAAIGATLASGLCLVAVGQAAQASGRPRTDAQLVAPIVHDGTSGFYTSNQIDEVWGAVVANYPAGLPDGYALPRQTPSFFHPADANDALFQTGLPDMIAGQLWRCSWLDARLQGTVSADALTKALAQYWLLPSIAAIDTRAESLSEDVLSRVATENGFATDDHALFALDCQGFQK